jgi:2,5-diamino-6-(ribosylamino)-4(3H)-pyrimidinone 5'-phosphate reductase
MNPFSLSINMAMTIDGKVERPDGKWYGLSSRTDKARMDLYRSQNEILILGKNSILNDNPVIHLRYAEGEEPLPVILVRKGSIPENKNIFTKSKKKPLILTTSACYPELHQNLSSLANIEIIGDQDISPIDVINFLQKKGYSRFLLEGGPTLNHSFLSHQLVTTLYITVVPFLIGQRSLLGISNGNSHLQGFEEKSWNLTKVEHIQNEIFLKYEKISSLI